jgi:hypothetical protein
MAYTDLTLITPDRDGVTVADAAMTAAVAGGHQFVNDGHTLVYLLNTNAASRTITIATATTVDGLAVADVSIVLGAGNVTPVRVLTARFPRSVYNQADGKVLIDYSATAGVSVAAIKIPRELVQ